MGLAAQASLLTCVAYTASLVSGEKVTGLCCPVLEDGPDVSPSLCVLVPMCQGWKVRVRVRDTEKPGNT